MKRSSLTVALVLFVVTVLASGCISLGPQPEVVDSESERSLIDAFTGTSDVEATIVNNGAAGDVRVTVLVTDSNKTVLDKQSKVIQMDKDERRKVTIEVEFSEDAEDYKVEAVAAK